MVKCDVVQIVDRGYGRVEQVAILKDRWFPSVPRVDEHIVLEAICFRVAYVLWFPTETTARAVIQVATI